MTRVWHNPGVVSRFRILLPLALVAGLCTASQACPTSDSQAADEGDVAPDTTFAAAQPAAYDLIRISYKYSDVLAGTLDENLKAMIESVNNACKDGAYRARLMFWGNIFAGREHSWDAYTVVKFVSVRRDRSEPFRLHLMNDAGGTWGLDVRVVSRALNVQLVVGGRKEVINGIDVFSLFDAGKTQVQLRKFDGLKVAPVGDPQLWTGYLDMQKTPKRRAAQLSQVY
ncbi:MAG: hypothetical protein V1798_12275 [Pseudomonadota bacterium]